jgi:hypothetical protein
MMVMVNSFDYAFGSRMLNYVGFEVLIVVAMKVASAGKVKFYQTTWCHILEDTTLQKV